MPRRSRRLMSALSTVGAIALLSAIPAVPASAMPPDGWAPAGYFPSGCGPIVLNPSSVTYTDTTLPVLKSVEFTVNGVRSGRTLVVGPSGRSNIGVVGRVTSDCSGIGPSWVSPSYSAGQLYLRTTVGSTNQLGLIPLTHTGPVNSWNDLFEGEYLTLGSSTPTIPGGLGARIQPLFWMTAGRYTTFELDLDGQLIAHTDTSTYTSVSASNLAALQVLRQTVLTATRSARSVATGSSATVSGVLKMAGSNAWTRLSARVTLQRKIGTGAWRFVASATSSSTGRVSFRTTITRSASYRLVYAGNANAGVRATAPSTSSSVAIAAR